MSDSYKTLLVHFVHDGGDEEEMQIIMAAMPPSVLLSTDMHAAERRLCQSSEVMAKLVANHGTCRLADSNFPPFQTLVTSIISQQLSTKAANAIGKRVLELVPMCTPHGFLAVSHQAMRQAGLSMAKTTYIIELATRVNDGRLNLDALRCQPDEDVIANLTQLPGIGRWTSEMFLIFGLHRPDVLAIGDAGLQRAARLLYGDSVELENVGQVWKPYRSVASWYLWQHLDSISSA